MSYSIQFIPRNPARQITFTNNLRGYLLVNVIR